MRDRTGTLDRPTLVLRALGVASLIALATLASLALSAVSARDAGAQTPTGTATRTSELAPIEAVEVRVLKSLPAQYEVLVTSGLPGGCASFESISAQRAGTRIDVTVRNAMNVPASGACTAIYGVVRKTVNIGSDFQPGITYTVVVNGAPSPGGRPGVTTTFTTATATVSPAPDPGAPPPPALVPLPANVGTGGVAVEGAPVESPVELIDALIGGGAAAGAAVTAAVAVALIAIRIPRRRGH